jgi:2',3'-cyclic-nucleotide 2'-phosphodiesterase/3'-nucleotidase
MASGPSFGASYAATAELRVLATTDIHMQLLGHDYVRDKPVEHNGLAGLASLIKTARAEAASTDTPCLLVDNGDMLHGTALGEELAKQPVTPAHPLIASLNAMAYDAIGVGNHDLDYGLPYLERLAGLSRAPFLSTNLLLTEASTLLRETIVACPVAETETYGLEALNVGFLSVLPRLTGIWNKPVLHGKGHIIPAREALAEAVPRLRARGADVVILLAHMGIEDSETEDDVRRLASLPGIDAMVAGHTHRRLPGLDHAGFCDVNIDTGALGACPTAMPGFNASDLAILDLSLGWDEEDGTWQVFNHAVQLRANTQAVPADEIITSICASAHHNARAKLAEPVGHCTYPLHNFFSMATPTATCALIASTKRRIVEEILQGTPDARLPLLATSSAHTAGGRGGPDHFINIAPGMIYRRALTGLNPYSNAVWALRLSGAEVRDWLEHTVGIYTQLVPRCPDQPLLRADRPSFHFDTIYGLRYGVDPTQPQGRRITDIFFGDAPLHDNQTFILATNQFRAAGGGGGTQFDPSQIVAQCRITVADALLETLKSKEGAAYAGTAPWYFDCRHPVQAVLRTSHRAFCHLDEIAHLSPEPMPKDDEGFTPLRLSL